ncbi:MAG: HAMP domain-containing sensor histidine kinase [Bacteroidota bacterium]|jgi:signal transduction histidine kinase
MRIPRSANIKVVLLIIAVVIVVATLMYTRLIVKQLLQKEHEIASLYARSLQFLVTSPPEPADYSFVFDEIIRPIDFPIVLSDPDRRPLQPFQSNSRNVDLDTTLTMPQQQEYLQKTIAELDRENSPIPVTVQDSIVLSYVHYGESSMIKKLRWLPYIEIAVAGMFILIGYIGFSHIKRNEQSNIWVGMAKETAHQLGTPLSSLMGWTELIKTRTAGDPGQLDTISEIENDLQRLQKVTERFSKIGSKPSLKEENLVEVVQSVVDYFQKRLPSRADIKNIDLRVEATERITANVNRELFEWVIENLIKNALDAIENGVGSITISLLRKGNAVLIDVRDTGKGIDMRYKKDIFRPGYSTKQRGWGLGLSLSKRIVETYHKGKLFVKESKVGKGTTFRIKLVS